MRHRFLLFASVIIISIVLGSLSAVECTAVKTDNVEREADVNLISGKEELARQIFFEIRYVEDPAEKAALYRKAAEECSGTEFAQEALWKLSQHYVDGFDEPNIKEAIGCLEYFIKMYPNSEWRSHVEFSLLGLYENEKLWVKAASLCEKLIAENSNMPNSLKEELLRRYKRAKSGQTK